MQKQKKEREGYGGGGGGRGRELLFSKVQFSPLTVWVVEGRGEGRGTQGTIQRRSSSSLFCRRPL